jgi:VWFA-related protein
MGECRLPIAGLPIVALTIAGLPIAGLAVAGLTIVGLAIAGLPIAAQQLPKPTFETGVELISVDVNVVDKRGTPIADLKAEDFEVDISGRRRKISSLQFVSYLAPLAKPSSAPAAAPAAATAEVPRPHRMYVLAVDEHSLHTANAMAAVNAAERFIDRLQPDDLVGVYAYPTGVAQHDMTTDHASVRKVLQKIGGLFSEPANNLNLSPSEVIDCANNDRDCLQRVLKRECSGNACTVVQIRQEAISLSGLMETMASQSVGGLRGLLRSLKDVPGRKTLVLVSGGLVTTDQAGGRMNVRNEIAQVGRDASLANVNVFALHLDWSFIQAVTNRRGMRTSYFREANMAASGLEAIAGNAGGTVIRVQGTSPDVAFDRVLSETSGHYLLGVESIAEDRDGQPHPIRVKVKRGGAEVRSRTFVTIAAAKKDQVEASISASPCACGVTTTEKIKAPEGSVVISPRR